MKKKSFLFYFTTFLLFFSLLSISTPRSSYADCMSGITMIDTTQSAQTNQSKYYLSDYGKGFLHDSIQVASFAGASPMSVTLKVYNDKNDGNIAFIPYSGSSLNFSLEPVSYYLAKLGRTLNSGTSEKKGETYYYEIAFRASCTNRVAFTHAVSYQLPTSSVNAYSCNSKSNNNLLATQNGTGKLTLFTNNVVSGNFINGVCQASTAPGLSPQIIQNAGSKFSATNDPKFDSSVKDSVIYYPGSDHLVFVDFVGGGQVDAVYWDWKTGQANKQIDPTSVRIIPLIIEKISGFPGNTVDMELDDLGVSASPQNFWLVDQYGAIYKISWNAAILPIINPWLASIKSGGNAHNAPFNVTANKNDPSLFAATYFPNGIKVVDQAGGGANVYVAENAGYGINMPPVIRKYDLNGNIIQQISLGENFPAFGYSQLQGFIDPSFTNFQILRNSYYGFGYGRDWNIDGLTVSPDNKYIYVASSGGNVIWVLQNITTSTPSLLGPALTDMNCGSTNASVDGIEMDNNNMLYLTCQSNGGNGIYSVNGNDLISAATCNRNNSINGADACSFGGVTNPQLFKGAWAQTQLYYKGTNSYDDIAPLAGNGAASSVVNAPPYYTTCGGPVYSYGGYSINTLHVNPCNLIKPQNVFSSSLITETNGPATFPPSSQGSYWNWDFAKIPSLLDTIPSVKNSSSPQLTSNILYTLLCVSTQYVCPAIAKFQNNVQPDTISSTDTQINSNKRIVSYTPNSGTLNIDTDRNLLNGGVGGLQEDGILFVKKKPGVANSGNVVITADRADDWISQVNPHRLILIAEGDITINPSDLGGNNSTDIKQSLQLMALSDGNLKIADYKSIPAFPQYLAIKGSLVGWSSVSFQLNAGALNATTPAVQINYDPGYLLEFSNLFPSTTNQFQLGL